MNLIDGFPIVGHAKGICHLYAGNNDHAINNLLDASRGLIVKSVVVVVCGSTVPGIAYLVGGVVYDIGGTYVRKTILSRDAESYGYIAKLKSIDKSLDGAKNAGILVLKIMADSTIGVRPELVQDVVSLIKRSEVYKAGVEWLKGSETIIYVYGCSTDFVAKVCKWLTDVLPFQNMFEVVINLPIWSWMKKRFYDWWKNTFGTEEERELTVLNRRLFANNERNHARFIIS